MADLQEIISLRLNSEQLIAVKVWAQKHNVSISEVIRAAIEQMTGAKQ